MHNGDAFDGSNFQAATQFVDPFAHAAEANTHSCAGPAEFLEKAGRHSFSVVRDAEAHRGGIFFHIDFGGGASGMTMNVGQTLLQNTEEDQLDFFGHAAEVFGDIELDIDFAAPGEAVDVPLGGRSEAELIKEGRVQQIGERARFIDALLGERCAGLDQFSLKIRARRVRDQVVEIHL